jgi:NAD(P)-dependent dehydrogenase (short-subunit alcohol dehydrogenase family)
LTAERANLLDLSGKVILITGAAGGIGAASARALHAAGARVVLTDIIQRSVDEVANEIGGDRVLPLALDVTDRAAADAVVQFVVQRFGGLDVLFANAGMASEPLNSIAMIDERAFEKVIEVNLLGVWRCVRACLPQIIERRGHVLITASIYSYCNGMANSPYAASKAALEMLGRSLRAELAGTGATAGVLYPGWVSTPLSKVGFGGDELVTQMLNRAFPRPYKTAVMPDKIAAAVVRGMQTRAARIIVPKRWAPLYWFRGILGPLSDAILDRDTKIHVLMRALEDRDRNKDDGPPTSGLGPL